jgi:TolB protein
MRDTVVLQPSGRLWVQVITGLGSVTLAFMMVLVFSLIAASHAPVTPSGIMAFTSNEDGNWDIYVMDIYRDIARAVTRHPANDFGPVWSAVTGQFAFFSDRNGDVDTEIYFMGLNGSDVQPVVTGEDNYGQPYWSVDGQQIVFIRNFGNIRFMDVDGTNEHGLAYGFGPVWSPTNGHIAYYRDQRGNLNGDIYVINEDGGDPRNLTQHPAHDWDPAWSPDGRQLAFVSSRDGNAEIYVMDAACIAPCPANRLTHNSFTDSAPAWSLDGLFIAFESEINGRYHVFIMNADGTNPRPLNKGFIESRSPVWIDGLDT